MNKLLTLGLLGLLSLPAATQTAAAQADMPEIPPISAPDAAMPAPLALDKIVATLSAPRSVSGEFTLGLTLQNKLATSLNFSTGRDSDQGCAAAPAVRVLQVGTREVVYPTGQKSICTQEMKLQTAPAGGTTTFERSLTLPAGEYMLEGWFQGFAGESGQPVKIGAQPIRISVK